MCQATPNMQHADLGCLDQLPGVRKCNDLCARREEKETVEGVKSPNGQYQQKIYFSHSKAPLFSS